MFTKIRKFFHSPALIYCCPERKGESLFSYSSKASSELRDAGGRPRLTDELWTLAQVISPPQQHSQMKQRGHEQEPESKGNCIPGLGGQAVGRREHNLQTPFSILSLPTPAVGLLQHPSGLRRRESPSASTRGRWCEPCMQAGTTSPL